MSEYGNNRACFIQVPLFCSCIIHHGWLASEYSHLTIGGLQLLTSVIYCFPSQATFHLYLLNPQCLLPCIYWIVLSLTIFYLCTFISSYSVESDLLVWRIFAEWVRLDSWVTRWTWCTDMQWSLQSYISGVSVHKQRTGGWFANIWWKWCSNTCQKKSVTVYHCQNEIWASCYPVLIWQKLKKIKDPPKAPAWLDDEDASEE